LHTSDIALSQITLAFVPLHPFLFFNGVNHRKII